MRSLIKDSWYFLQNMMEQWKRHSQHGMSTVFVFCINLFSTVHKYTTCASWERSIYRLVQSSRPAKKNICCKKSSSKARFLVILMCMKFPKQLKIKLYLLFTKMECWKLTFVSISGIWRYLRIFQFIPAYMMIGMESTAVNHDFHPILMVLCNKTDVGWEIARKITTISWKEIQTMF